jgi:hypothetical protein
MRIRQKHQYKDNYSRSRMAYPKRKQPLTQEEKRARDRAYQHTRRHKGNNITARVHNKAARLAAQWVQEEHPQKWAALVRKAKEIEEGNATEYVPHSVKFGGNGSVCSHDKVVAVGIMRQCASCGEFLGAYPVDVPSNKQMLQEILEAEGGA